MPTHRQIQITGKVAEIIDNEQRYIRIICKSSNMMIELKNIDDISLGDKISITGNLSVETGKVNGIEVESYKQ